MSSKALIRDVKKSIDLSLGNCKAIHDFQTARVYNYHYDLHEKNISETQADKIVKRLDRLWRIKTIQLYPEKWDEPYGESWTLSKRKAVIQLKPSLVTTSLVIHEHSHGVIESFREYFPEGKNIREPGHGPLFCGIYTFNYSWITGKPYLDIIGDLEYYSLRVLGKDPVLKFKKFFKEHG